MEAFGRLGRFDAPRVEGHTWMEDLVTNGISIYKGLTRTLAMGGCTLLLPFKYYESRASAGEGQG